MMEELTRLRDAYSNSTTKDDHTARVMLEAAIEHVLDLYWSWHPERGWYEKQKPAAA
jgi:hypothetical protein